MDFSWIFMDVSINDPWWTPTRMDQRAQVATQPVLLSHLARRLVDEAHAKSEASMGSGLPYRK